MNPRRNLAVLVALAATTATAQDASWRVLPPDPSVGEDFMVMARGNTGNVGAHVQSSSLAFSGGILWLSAVVDNSADFSVGSPFRATGAMRATTAGTFQVGFSFNILLAGQRREGELGSLTIAPQQPAVTPTFRNLSANWFAPGEPGWGFNLIQNGAGQLSGVWMTYRSEIDVTRRDMATRKTSYGLWLFMPNGRWVTPTRFRGLLYETTGTPVGTAFDLNQVRSIPYGMATFDVVSATEIDFTGDVTVEPHVGSLSTPAPLDRVVTKRLVRLDP